VALTRWDARVVARGFGVGTLVFALMLLVTAATDEGGLGWAERLSRTLPLAPACAAVGAWGALAPARARGEILALQAVGRSPAQVAAAAVAGGALVACLAALALLSAPLADGAAFFPRAVRPSAWAWSGAVFVDHARGLRVEADGTPVRMAPDATTALAALPVHGVLAAALAIASAGLALPLLVGLALARPGGHAAGRATSDGRADAAAVVASAAAVVATIVLFQAAAVGRVPALAGGVPCLALLAFAIRRYRADA